MVKAGIITAMMVKLTCHLVKYTNWGAYRGDRIGIYTYNNNKEEGYIDADFFHYTYSITN